MYLPEHGSHRRKVREISASYRFTGNIKRNKLAKKEKAILIQKICSSIFLLPFSDFLYNVEGELFHDALMS